MDIPKIFYIITNILFVYTVCITYVTFLGKPKKPLLTYSTFVLYYIADILIYFYVKIPIVFTFGSTIMCFLLTLSFSQKLGKKIVTALVISVTATASEAIGTGLVSLFSQSITINEAYCLAYVMIFSRILFFIVCYIFIQIYKKRKYHYNNRTVFPAVLLMILSILILYIAFNFTSTIFEPFTAKANISILIPSVLVIALNIFTYYAYEHKQHIIELKERNNMLNTTIQIQQNQYLIEDKLREQFRKEKHNYKNFLVSIEAQLSMGQVDEAILSINNHIGLLSNKIYSNSGCYTLDSIVNYKAEFAHEQGIEIVTDYQIEDDIKIKSEDLCVLFGIALDNAIEYLSSHKDLEQKITIYTEYSKGVFTFIISNPVAEVIPIIDNSVASTKNDPAHGIGIESAKHILSKYDSTINLNCENYVFSIGACVIT